MKKVIKRLKCIKTFDAPFTIGEYYDITNEGTIGGIPVYYAKNNNGYSDWVIHYTFETVEDKRDLILAKILGNDNNSRKTSQKQLIKSTTAIDIKTLK